MRRSRHRRAWELIEARGRAAATLDGDKLSDPEHYLQTAQEMAKELAGFYYPKSEDLIGALTVPEILAVIELAAHDLSEMVDRYLPGGHLLTIRDWQGRARRSPTGISPSTMCTGPSRPSSRRSPLPCYGTSKLGLSGPLKLLQQNLLVWFYTAFLQRLGTYLIELYSGRLRVGARCWRELVLKETAPRPPALEDSEGAIPEGARHVTFTLMGQVKAGKSSLVNALLGEQRAQTDVLPATSGVERYRLAPQGVPAEMELLDTVGYGHDGPKADQVTAMREAAQQSDLLLLVLHALNPARQADLLMLAALREWFVGRPELKMPPIVAVVSHVDLLSPKMEWQPPYNWQQPQRPKERNIHEALAAVREQLGDAVVAVVPVCTTPGRVWGIDEALLPVLAARLDEVHAVSLLRCLHAEADTRKVRKVFDQLLTVGKTLARAVWQDLKAPRH